MERSVGAPGCVRGGGLGRPFGPGTSRRTPLRHVSTPVRLVRASRPDSALLRHTRRPPRAARQQHYVGGGALTRPGGGGARRGGGALSRETRPRLGLQLDPLRRIPFQSQVVRTGDPTTTTILTASAKSVLPKARRFLVFYVVKETPVR